jgi:type II secretory pathway component GspD/PulD (secretin)
MKSTKTNLINASFKYAATAIAALMLTGCLSPDLRYTMDDAKDSFKNRQLTNGGKLEEGDANDGLDGYAKQRRKLVQFRYAQNSFDNPDFQAFLQRLTSESSYALEGGLPKNPTPLTGVERELLIQERVNKRRILVAREMRKIQSQLNAFGAISTPGNWKTHAELTFKGTLLPLALNKLSQQTNVTIQISDKARTSKIHVTGSYKGDALNILKQLSMAHGFEVRIGMQDQSIHVLTAQEATSAMFSANDYFNPFAHNISDTESIGYLRAYRDIASSLASGDADAFNRRMGAARPPAAQGSIATAYERLVRGAASLNQSLRNFDQETNAIKNGLIPNSNLGEREISPAILSKGLLDRNVCPGQEVVTEKLFVYQEAPKEVVKFLEGYFKTNDVAAPPPVASPLATQVGLPVAAQPKAAASSAVAMAGTGKRARFEVAKDPDAERCAAEPTKVQFKVLEDPTGVIVTGTVSQIELAARLTDDVDVATKQVLAEVFLVEVQKNWARTIETKINRQTSGGSSSIGAVSNVIPVLDAATLATSKGVAGAQGRFSANGGDVNAFINLLESNSVGRNISSPTLIAKNGEEAEISKVVTLRKTVQTVVNAAVTGQVTQPALPNQQVQKLDVPLKLKIKPVINQHNKHVTLKFEYEETILNPEAADSPIEKGTTKNSITTTLETAPGDVVVLAGLFKEANAKSTSSLPGLSSTGIFATLFGGSDGLSTQSTELLVFIKPTVIESQIGSKKTASAR